MRVVTQDGEGIVVKGHIYSDGHVLTFVDKHDKTHRFKLSEIIEIRLA
jgi:hypothetical protein